MFLYAACSVDYSTLARILDSVVCMCLRILLVVLHTDSHDMIVVVLCSDTVFTTIVAWPNDMLA